MGRVRIFFFGRSTLLSFIFILSGLLLIFASVISGIFDKPTGGEGSMDEKGVSVIYTGTDGPSDEEEGSEAAKLPGSGGKLAIIIDDFGSGRNGVEEMMAIHRHLTFAVMPFCPYSQLDAESARKNGYEVIVHLPMEPIRGKNSWLGPRGILSGMNFEEVRQIVKDSFENVPFAAGANIHMGSKASGEETVISAVLDVIKEKGLIFVDSRTATRPIGKKLAGEKGVLCFDRDVFLDGQQPKYIIKKRLSEAAQIAAKRGYAIAMGHVGVEGGTVTAEAINEMLPELDRMNVQLVFLSELKK